MTAGLLVRKMTLPHNRRTLVSANGMPPDNWIYIQEPDVKIGRLQVFNNWSPSLVADPATIWLGLEYFCREGDDLWSMADGRFLDFAARELAQDRHDRPRAMCSTARWCACPRPIRPISANMREFGKVRDLSRPLRQSVSRRPQWHAPLQQSRSLHAGGQRGGRRSIMNGGAGKADIWRINAEEDYHEESRRAATHTGRVTAMPIAPTGARRVDLPGARTDIFCQLLTERGSAGGQQRHFYVKCTAFQVENALLIQWLIERMTGAGMALAFSSLTGSRRCFKSNSNSGVNMFKTVSKGFHPHRVDDRDCDHRHLGRDRDPGVSELHHPLASDGRFEPGGWLEDVHL